MLSTVLTQLQALVSPRFVVASFFPMLAFWFAHAVMLFAVNAPFRAFAQAALNQPLGTSTALVAAALIGIAMSAYVLAAVLPAIQSLMEGNWPSWLVSIFVPAQTRCLERIDAKLDENDRLRGRITASGNAPDGQTAAEAWRSSLTKARQVGAALGANQYRSTAKSAQTVQRLANLRRRSRAVSADDLNAAVTELIFDLRANNADQLGPDGDWALENTRKALWKLIAYADQFAAGQYRLLLNKREFSFGALPLAPTRMGNVARTIQTYAVKRYEFNFDLFWSRMQRLLQKDKDFGPILQAAKEQLDFLISCSFLTFAWSVGWSLWLFLTSGPRWMFLAVALAGPMLSWGWYRAASAHYRTFADVLRTSVDLFRFDLLDDLHFPRPSSVKEERYLWQTLDALQSLGEVRDERYVGVKAP